MRPHNFWDFLGFCILQSLWPQMFIFFCPFPLIPRHQLHPHRDTEGLVLENVTGSSGVYMRGVLLVHDTVDTLRWNVPVFKCPSPLSTHFPGSRHLALLS